MVLFHKYSSESIRFLFLIAHLDMIPRIVLIHKRGAEGVNDFPLRLHNASI